MLSLFLWLQFVQFFLYFIDFFLAGMGWMFFWNITDQIEKIKWEMWNDYFLSRYAFFPLVNTSVFPAVHQSDVSDLDLIKSVKTSGFLDNDMKIQAHSSR